MCCVAQRSPTFLDISMEGMSLCDTSPLLYCLFKRSGTKGDLPLDSPTFGFLMRGCPRAAGTSRFRDPVFCPKGYLRLISCC
jgi:hypothetical protein